MIKERGKKGIYLFYDQFDQDFIQNAQMLKDYLVQISEDDPNM